MPRITFATEKERRDHQRAYQREYRRKNKARMAEYQRSYQQHGAGRGRRSDRISCQCPVEPPTGNEWWFKDSNLRTSPEKSLHTAMPPEKFAAKVNRVLEGIYA